MFAAHIYKNNAATPTGNDPFFSSTSLLLHGDGTNGAQNNIFLDSSSNNFPITRVGEPTQGSFSPYPLSGVAYDPATNGGSGYFDGSGDYLDTATDASVAFGTGDFTIEFWAYFNLHKNYIELLDARPNVQSSPSPVLYTDVNGILYYWVNAANRITSSSAIPINSWVHIGLSRQGTSTKMFVNGVQTGITYSDSVIYTHTSYRIGSVKNGNSSAAINYSMNGYISNLRVVKGTALYTSNFTPPTSPVTATSNGGATPSTLPTPSEVSLLCDFTNAGIFDNTAKNDLITVGNAQVSAAVKKFGSGSMYFDGSGDYIDTATDASVAFGTGDFTIEFWVYFNSNSSAKGLLDGRPNISNSPAPTIYSINGVLYYFVNLSNRITGPTIPNNSWTHIAVSRQGTNTRMFVDGTQVGSTWSDSTNYTHTSYRVGSVKNGNSSDAINYSMNGYIDDLRITKGVARYTANFAVPTQAFPNQ